MLEAFKSHIDQESQHQMGNNSRLKGSIGPYHQTAAASLNVSQNHSIEEKKALKRSSLAGNSHNTSQQLKPTDVYYLQRGEGKENLHSNSNRQGSAQYSKKSFLAQTAKPIPQPTTTVCHVDLVQPAMETETSVQIIPKATRQSNLSSSQNKSKRIEVDLAHLSNHQLSHRD